MLKLSGPQAFDAFVNALEETGQHDLADLLVPTTKPNRHVLAHPADSSSRAAGGANPTSNPQSNLSSTDSDDQVRRLLR